jgi:hypothetical protein
MMDMINIRVHEIDIRGSVNSSGIYWGADVWIRKQVDLMKNGIKS